MTTGIYLLKFKGTEKVYVGQAKNIEARFSQHKTNMRGRYNCSDKLQTAYDTYGEPTIDILVECSIDELDMAEKEAIDIFDSVKNGFNTCSEGTTTISNDIGTHAKYSKEQILGVVELLLSGEYTRQEISKQLHINLSVINDIAAGTRHKWLANEIPEEYHELLLLKGTHIRNTAIQQGVEYPPVVSPLGEVYQITHLNEFARKNNLDASALCRVLKGKAITHKGWKVLDEHTTN